MSDSNKEHLIKSEIGKDDVIERIGEFIFASAGVFYAIYGGLTGKLDNIFSFLILIISFGLYQGTSMIKYFKVWKR